MNNKDQSMLGKWDNWYKFVTKITPIKYGDSVTYKLAEEYLKGMDIEDWGAGTGAFKKFHQGGYIAIDGTQNPFADVIVDLRKFQSKTDGIMMRHVLEHNYNWTDVLDNALHSFSKRMCLVLFTPFGEKTKVIADNNKYGVDVPDISFKKDDIERRFAKFKDITWTSKLNLRTRTGYKTEHIYFLERKNNL